ncbi:MAG: hypothetical protein V1772_10485 [Chloroflexota bacterium]
MGTRLVYLLVTAALLAMTGLAVSADPLADTTPPELLNYFTVEPSVVNTMTAPGTVTVTAYVKDVGSGVNGDEGLYVRFLSPSENEELVIRFYHGVEGQPDALIDEDLWQASATLPMGSEPGEWLLESFFMADRAEPVNNAQSLSWADLRARGLPYSFTVVAPAQTLYLPVIGR